jgi:signal transduction histidine kinase
MRGPAPFLSAQAVAHSAIGRQAAQRKAPLSALARWCLMLALAGPALLPAMEGLPVTRFYPFEEIGNVSRGAHLNFDAFGRIAVVQRGTYAVLNDGAWLELSEAEAGDVQILETRPDHDGVTYYGALGSWGILTATPTGKLRPDSLVPADYPKWVLATNFDQILCTARGVYFAGLNGVVFWSRATKRHQFFEVSGVSRLFAHGGSVFVSSHSKRLFVLDADRETPVLADSSAFASIVVGRFASAGSGRAVAATTFRRLVLIRDHAIHPLPPPLDGTLPGNITALQSLPEGGVAAAVLGVGLYILDADGNIKTKLTGPDYAQITALASNEGGVLWAATETGVMKILHGHPYTVFGQALGLPVEWPQLVSWNGQLIVASRGRFYEPLPAPVGEPTRFRQIPGQPGAGGWGIATAGSSLLVGNGNGVYVREPAGAGFTLAVPGIDATRLVALDHETCLVIGTDEITALRRRDGIWSEYTPRIPGLGYPFIVHRGKNSAWIELGVNRAARISLDSGRIEARIFESFPWTKPGWVNISVVGSTVVLAGPENKPVFFDENTRAVTDAPGVRELFDQSPHPIQRIAEDDTGLFWGSFQHGILSFAREAGRLTIDSTTYGAINEQIPLVQALPGGDIWVSSGQSLYHLDRKRARLPAPQFQPVLTSIRDGRTQAERFRTNRGLVPPGTLSYRDNSITFSFFAGSYSWKRVPAYEFRLNDEPWHTVAGSTLVFSDLPEGDYQLNLRLTDNRGPIGKPWRLNFSVAPPWYRTPYALATYPLLAVAVLFGLLRYSLRRAKARTAALEKLVADRTRELQTTMNQLQRETQTSATLAERNRLAGEIHDSLEQGFTGLTLQIETTANFSSCPPEVKNGLAVALNMVAFSRNEVRHAVQNLHSPILDSADLETALRHIVAQTVPSPGYATIRTEGSPRPLGSTVEHHLLRIAQEAITNAVKHASASRLEVVLSFGPSGVQLAICDDGRGFDPGAVLNSNFGHFGLPSFRGRASKIGGTVEIISRPGAGTRIVVHVPLEPDISRQP